MLIDRVLHVLKSDVMAVADIHEALGGDAHDILALLTEARDEVGQRIFHEVEPLRFKAIPPDQRKLLFQLAELLKARFYRLTDRDPVRNRDRISEILDLSDLFHTQLGLDVKV